METQVFVDVSMPTDFHSALVKCTLFTEFFVADLLLEIVVIRLSQEVRHLLERCQRRASLVIVLTILYSFEQLQQPTFYINQHKPFAALLHLLIFVLGQY